MAVAMNSVGLIFQDRQEYDSAMVYFMRALALDEESEHGVGVIWSARYCGELWLICGRFAEAMRYFERSLDWSRRINDRKKRSDFPFT
jgi:tetratricopeptide (TPR) repeat protein